jgi:8-oxo-dGTP pyrophosphatase MutT (NUDIX family)
VGKSKKKREVGGAVPYRYNKSGDAELAWTRKPRGRWTLAKGGVEPEDRIPGTNMYENAATREAFEEGGFQGEIVRSLGTYSWTKRDGRTDEVNAFLFKVTDNQPWKRNGKDADREIGWFPLNQTETLASESGNSLSAIMDSLRRFLD